MKRKILYTLMITLLLLSACGNSDSYDESATTISKDASPKADEEPSTENNQSSQDQSSETPKILTDVSETNSTFKSLDELENQAEELASSSEEITEGELYDSITAIYPDVVIHTNANNDLSIRINLNHDTVENDSLSFFDTIISICGSCALENNSSNISYIMTVDGELVTMLSMLNYISFANFSTSSPVVFIDEYKESINYIYSSLFSKNDIANQFDDNLDSLEKKYNVTN